MTKDEIKKIEGCLVGGAVGDALGSQIEFLNQLEIKGMYGEKGLTEYVLDTTTGKALISDDTQMSLFTANALLWRLGAVHPIPSYNEAYAYYHSAYMEWYRLQKGERLTEHHCWLCDVPQLASRRAPGSTCLDALSLGFSGLIDDPINNSKGCGAVMRVASIGLLCFASPDQDAALRFAMQEAAAAAAVTHGHPLSWLSAAALVYIVHRAAFDSKNGLYEIAQDCCDSLQRVFPEMAAEVDNLNAAIHRAIDLSHRDISDAGGISMLGEGWEADESLAIALFCALRHPNFSAAIIAAANHSGDSDSTASICGNIVGALLGYDAIERKWLDKLEIVDVIQEMADDLCALPDVIAGNISAESAENWNCKYQHGQRRKTEIYFELDGDHFRKEADIAQLMAMAGEHFIIDILQPFLAEGCIRYGNRFNLSLHKNVVTGSIGTVIGSRSYEFPKYIFIGILKEAARQHLRSYPHNETVCKHLLEEIEQKYR